MLRFEKTENTYNIENIDKICANHKDISLWTARMLVNRGADTYEKMRAFLYPDIKNMADPFLLNDMEKAIDRIHSAVENNEHICVYGDYDVDGICATSLLLRFLYRIGGNATFHIPSRHLEGYGMNKEAVRKLAEDGIKLIVTVDNGIVAFEETELCKQLGVDVIVTDHHTCQNSIPDCVAVVAHTRKDCNYPDNICGAATAFKLVNAMMIKYYPELLDTLEEYIPLAGLATVADVMPLSGENRILVYHTIKLLNTAKCDVGLKMLARESKTSNGAYNVHDLSFGIAPRLNASGRMENASIGVELFITDDEVKALQLSKKLSELNELRKKEENDILNDALEMLKDRDMTDERIIILSSDKWNPGVIGIAASRIAERFYRPTILLYEHDGVLSGSSRSIKGVNIFDALNSTGDLFLKFGGHALAAGLSLEKDRIDELKKNLEKYIRENISDDVFIPVEKFEFECELNEISNELVFDISRLAPFGEGNPQPIFVTRNVKLGSLRRIGKEAKHLSATAFKNNCFVDIVAFNKGEMMNEILDMDKADILYTPELNEWNGIERLHIKVRSIVNANIENAMEYTKNHKNKFYSAFWKNLMYNNIDNGIMDLFELSYVSYMSFDEFIAQDVADKITGSLVICFTGNGTYDYIRKYSDKFVSDIVWECNKNDQTAYNTVAFAPIIDNMNVSRFRRIYLYDGALSSGIIGKIHKLAPEAHIYVPLKDDWTRFEKSFRLLANEFYFDRDLMIKFYSSIKNMQSNNRVYNKTAIEGMKKATGEDEYKCLFALNVFVELGFMSLDENENIVFNYNAEKKELDESESYALIKHLNNFNKK